VQRELAVEEERVARKAIEDAGGEVLELQAEERAAFVKAVQPLHEQARGRFGGEMFSLLRAPVNAAERRQAPENSHEPGRNR
jgi:TRAP-type C4-dicarboxylate transport system substrate-binding protein